MTAADNFGLIASAGLLAPQFCPRMKEKLLYLSYGAIHYRPGEGPTRRRGRLPVAFLFQPSVLSEVEHCYPLDTGALLSGRLGKRWLREFSPLGTKCAVLPPASAAAPRLVFVLYGSNDNYLHGRPNPEGKYPYPILRHLLKFLNADATSRGIDQRQHTIECHVPRSIGFDARLMWVAYPKGYYETEYLSLCKGLGGDRPDAYSYDVWATNFDPDRMAEVLAEQAAAIIKKRFLK